MAIAWREWSAEAFNEAKALDRLVVLSISASWCHWCHVMDRTSWADPEIEDLIAREFVPIRVDTDRRPDINQRYNLGGWPTTAILTPTGEVLTGGTYIPPDDLKQTLRDVVRVYHSRKSEIYSEILKRKAKREELYPLATTMTDEMVEKAWLDIEKSIMRSFDPVYGGFGVAPKFPALDPLEYCLNRTVATGDERFRSIALHSLKAMATGGLWDPVEGGFFRYATQEDWTAPHYEKMLEDNARFVELLSRAHAYFPDDFFMNRALEIVAYLKKHLRDPASGLYWGSQDASEEYYALDNLEARQHLGAPAVDRTFYSGWNALLARALIRAGLFLGRPDLRSEGLAILSSLGSRVAEDQPLIHCWNGASVSLDYLEDYHLLCDAFLEAFEDTGDARFLEPVQKLLKRAFAVLWDAERGVYRDTPSKSDAPGHEQIPRYPLTENSHMAILLLRWSALMDDEKSLQQSASILSAFQKTFVAYGIFAATYAEALRAHKTGPARILIIPAKDGTGHNDFAIEMITLARRSLYPAKAVIPPDAVHRFGGPEFDAPKENGPAAFVCVGKVCFPPVRDPESLHALLSRYLA